MEFGKAYNDITKLMIYVVFFTTSYAALFPVSYLDDLAIIIIAFAEIIVWMLKRESISKYVGIILTLLSVQLVWLVISILIGNSASAIQSFLTYLKIIVIFMMQLVQGFINKERMLRNMVLLSIPNIVYAMYEFFCTYIRGIYLPGKYDSSGYYRLQGLTGHPIFFSLLLVVLLAYFLYFSNNKARYIFIPICFLFSMLTWSELAQVGAILLIGYKVFEYTKVRNIFARYVAFISTCLLSGLLLVIFAKMFRETYTIRYVSVMETLKSVDIYNVLMGHGFGTFIDKGLSESYLFHVFYESGLIGSFLLGIILIALYKGMSQSKNYVGIFILSLYVVSMFINEGYMVPFIAFIPILCGLQVRKEKSRRIYIVFD